jgi:hypothetical protein
LPQPAFVYSCSCSPPGFGRSDAPIEAANSKRQIDAVEGIVRLIAARQGLTR